MRYVSKAQEHDLVCLLVFSVLEDVALRLENEDEEVVGVKGTPSSSLVRNFDCLQSTLEIAYIV